MRRRSRVRRVSLAIGVLAARIAPAFAQGVDAPMLPVAIEQGQTLRGVVADHLGDPDLWPVVLEINGIGSIDAAQPGAILMMPVGQVAAADDALARSLAAIQSATAEGARLFAPVEIAGAIENREMAIARRGKGAWADAVARSDVALSMAEEALRISLEQRDRAAEALLTDAHGSVEGRAPAQAGWSGRQLNDILVEFERVRTRSASTAQVTFRDLSRLRLNPNSNAIIQTMRTDPLTGGEVTKVNLLSGDFYALLNQMSERARFEIDVDGIQTSTESADFWVQSEPAVARFANYDEAELRIGEGPDSVSIGANEGAVVGRDGSSQVTDVLAGPVPLAPGDGAELSGQMVELGWEPAPQAAAYWLEVAVDDAFNQMQLSEWGIPETSYELRTLTPGSYHWRIAALDSFGLPGQWSHAANFHLMTDTTPPYLAIFSPTDGALVDEPRLEFAGETEPGARLVVNGTPVEVRPDGGFAIARKTAPGLNTLVFEAVDAAGNRTERALAITYRPAESVTIEIDATLPRDPAGVVLTRTDDLALRALTDGAPGAPVRLVGASGEIVAQTVVGPDQDISLTAPAAEHVGRYMLEILSPGGAVEGREEISILRDASPPVLRFDEPPPQATAAPALDLSGTAEDAVSLSLDGRELGLADGRFAVSHELAPGRNAFEFVARDRAGNVQLTKFVVSRDNEAPVIVDARVARDQAARQIEVVATVEEAVGLRSVGRYTLSVAGAEETGLLRCDPVAGVCRATQPDRAGELTLLDITVEDYAGNVGSLGN